MSVPVLDFERHVLEIEDVLIVIRAPIDAQVKGYEYQRQCSGGISVKEWLENRIVSCLGDYTCTVIDGHFQKPHGRTKMATLRASYER